MFTRKKIFIVAGITLLSFSAVWRFALVPRWTERIPVNWEWRSDFIGVNAYPDPKTGMMPKGDVTGTYTHAITIKPNSRQSGALELEDRFLIKDVLTGTTTWEYNVSAQVATGTGAHTKKEYQGDYFLFPRNVEQKTYKLRLSYLKGIPVIFQREEDVKGLATYLFAYHGRGEYTEAYAGTAEYPGTKVQPGQEIKCANDQLVFKVWVEPVTGEMIKIEENCNSNDYIYDIASGKQLAAVDRWAGETAGDDVINRVDTVTKERAKLLRLTRDIPLGLLAAGLLCFGLVMLPRRSSKNETD
jgi:hypothetical protein